MKKTLLLLCALLSLCVSGVWATTADEAALPQAGRTYYIHSYFYWDYNSSTYRNYLWYDSSSSSLKADAKQNATYTGGEAAYLWLCIDRGSGKYRFYNLASNTYLNWKAMGSAYDWDLTKDVTNSDCIPLYGTNYMIAKPGTANDINNYSTAIYTSGWTSDWKVEEYYPVNSLEEDAIYYISCATETPVYLSNGTGTTLSRSTSLTESDINSMWICKKNGDCYQFVNVNGNDYLSYKATSTTPHDFLMNPKLSAEGKLPLFSASVSVVSTMAATLAAFSSAERVTLVGSTMPASIISVYFSCAASKP